MALAKSTFFLPRFFARVDRVPQVQKFSQVAAVIERRICNGDYLLRPVPSERKIAEETGVSHMTARKAVRVLLDRNVLVRRANGALAVSPDYHAEAAVPQLLLLCPTFPSVYLTQLCQIVSAAAEEYGLSTRPVPYVHWDDPMVVRALGNRGGAILIPASLDLPAHVLDAIRANRVASLDLDLSALDVPSIRLFSDSHFFKIFEHLRQLGHCRVDCITTHVKNAEIERRVDLWRQWCQRHHIKGELHEHSAPSFSDPTPFAYEAMRRVLDQRRFKATAIVGTTFPAAIGAMRACGESGLIIGKTVSICAMNIESPARFLTPSVTGLDIPDLSKILRQCFDWFTSGKQWHGSKRLEPSRARFFAGESTGPVVSET